MTKQTFITKMLGGKIAVLRITHHYPKGTLVAKCRTQADADNLIMRQTAEDAANRLARVQDYLVERAARPAVVAVPSNQLEMFA